MQVEEARPNQPSNRSRCNATTKTCDEDEDENNNKKRPQHLPIKHDFPFFSHFLLSACVCLMATDTLVVAAVANTEALVQLFKCKADALLHAIGMLRDERPAGDAARWWCCPRCVLRFADAREAWEVLLLPEAVR